MARGRVLRSAALLGAIVASTALSACGGASSSSGTSASSEPTHAASSQDVRVRVGLTPFNGANVPQLVGEEIGAFESKGLALSDVPITSPATLVPALLSGSVDVTLGSLANIAPALLKGQPIRLFCGLAANKAAELLVSADSDLQSVAAAGGWQAVLRQLKGRKVGVPAIGVEDYQRLVASVRAAGVDPKSVEFVAVGVGTTATAALRTGQIDVLLAYPFEDAPLLAARQARALLPLAPPSGPPLFQNTWSYGFIAKSDWIKAHAQTAKSFCQAMGASIDALNDPQHAGAVTAVLERDGNLKGPELPIAKQDLKKYGFSTALPTSSIEASVHVLVNKQILPKVVPYDTLVLEP